MPLKTDLMTIGALSARSGLATSALRFYESEGLISSERTDGGQRRFRRSTLRRVAFVQAAQRVGLSLDEIRSALGELPNSRTPTKADWAHLSAGWRPILDKRIREYEQLREALVDCIGCGCLSLKTCALQNPGDETSDKGPGARYLLVNNGD